MPLSSSQSLPKTILMRPKAAGRLKVNDSEADSDALTCATVQTLTALYVDVL
jgi:hypothetical protein